MTVIINQPTITSNKRRAFGPCRFEDRPGSLAGQVIAGVATDGELLYGGVPTSQVMGIPQAG